MLLLPPRGRSPVPARSLPAAPQSGKFTGFCTALHALTLPVPCAGTQHLRRKVWTILCGRHARHLRACCSGLYQFQSFTRPPGLRMDRRRGGLLDLFVSWWGFPVDVQLRQAPEAEPDPNFEHFPASDVRGCHAPRTINQFHWLILLQVLRIHRLADTLALTKTVTAQHRNRSDFPNCCKVTEPYVDPRSVKNINGV